MAMFDDMNQALPWPTMVVINLSNVLSQYWWILGGVGFIAGVFIKQWLNTPQGQNRLANIQLKLPMLGDFIRLSETGRFARTLGTLLDSGVAINTALNSVWGTVENVILRDEIKKIADEVTGGSNLKSALKKCAFFPELAVNMISVGEETGNLPKGLYKVADSYERQMDETVKTMLSLLGPLILVFIVCIVGFVVVAMLMPIFEMNSLMQ